MSRLILFSSLVAVCTSSLTWSDHDTSTLKMLQVVTRHGDRANIAFVPHDPYYEAKYWPEGLGQLDTRGKYRMFRRGQFIRQAYGQYLGDQYSPRDVYARSSITDRCVESLQLLLAGAYPPKQEGWQWGNGSDPELAHLWQPIPIYTFMPQEDDLVLNDRRYCQAVQDEIAKIVNRSEIVDLIAQNREFYANLTKITGKRIFDLNSASSLHTELSVEIARGYYWDQVWTKEEELEVVKRLEPIEDLRYKNGWDSPVIHRLRAGGLVRELNNNFRTTADGYRDEKKVYIYSTHDTVLTALLGALNIFNDKAIPLGASLYLELHQTSDKKSYFLRAYYHNETDIDTEAPHLLPWKDCSSLTDCPYDRYLNSTQHLLYKTTDFDKECNPEIS